MSKSLPTGVLITCGHINEGTSMSIFGQFETSLSAEQQGIRIECEPNADGSVPTFIIARMGGANKAYSAELLRATKPHTAAIRMSMLSETTARNIARGVFCKTVLLGWENVQESNGVPIEFNYDNALALMDRLPNLYDMLSSIAQDAAAFKKSETEATAKN